LADSNGNSGIHAVCFRGYVFYRKVEKVKEVEEGRKTSLTSFLFWL
jgi:hypothetical protein